MKILVKTNGGKPNQTPLMNQRRSIPRELDTYFLQLRLKDFTIN